MGGTACLGEGAFLGINSCVLPGLKVGEWAVLGAGAVAVTEIPSAAVAVGVPARVGERSGTV